MGGWGDTECSTGQKKEFKVQKKLKLNLLSEPESSWFYMFKVDFTDDLTQFRIYIWPNARLPHATAAEKEKKMKEVELE